MALPPRQDGGAHDRQQNGNRGLGGRCLPHDHVEPAALRRSLGDSKPALTMMAPAALYATPNALAPDYTRFRVAERLLLTGHSHQAWPDCALEGQLQAFDDAARFVDDKWEHAFAKAERVRRGFAALLDDRDGDYALGASTHDLVVRLLSALPLRSRPRIVTTDAEFHTLRRQLDRIAEEGVEVVKVSHVPASDVAERLTATIDDRTALALVSAGFYTNSHVVRDLRRVVERCRMG